MGNLFDEAAARDWKVESAFRNLRDRAEMKIENLGRDVSFLEVHQEKFFYKSRFWALLSVLRPSFLVIIPVLSLHLFDWYVTGSLVHEYSLLFWLSGILTLAFDRFKEPRFAEAPNGATNAPLSELQRFASRSSRTLMLSFYVCMAFAASIHLVVMGLVLGAAWLVVEGRGKQAVVFGGGGVGGIALAQKWGPWKHAQEARKLANEADALNLGLQQRMATIQQIEDPVERERAAWQATLDYLEESRPNKHLETSRHR